MVEDERVEPDPLLAELADGVLLDLVLDAAAAERADLASVGVDGHQCAGLLRRRAARLHHLAEEQLAAFLQGSDQMSDDVAHAAACSGWDDFLDPT